jgi:hypothetical protein
MRNAITLYALFIVLGLLFSCMNKSGKTDNSEVSSPENN